MMPILRFIDDYVTLLMISSRRHMPDYVARYVEITPLLRRHAAVFFFFFF